VHVFSNSGLTGQELAILLQGLPSLVELVIEERSITEFAQEDALTMVTAQVLKQMTHDASGSSHLLVPKLKRLHIIARLDFDGQIILDVIRS
jgi:hypothetical protein